MKMHINKLSYIWLLLLLTLGCNEKTLKINYKITFEANGGLPAPKVQNVALGDTVRRPAAMTKASHTFTGWYIDAGLKSRYDFSVLVTSALKLYASWDVVSYRVEFKANGGLPAPKVQNVALGDTLRLPAAMTKAGHAFTGWYSDVALKSLYSFSSPVTSSLTLYAGWSSLISHKVVFEANDGLPAPSAQDVSHGDTLRLPAAMTKAGYTFTGWYIDAGLKSRYDFSVLVKSNLTLYAGWSSVSYKVVFEADGGIPAPPGRDVFHGATLRLPAAMTKANHTFTGWYIDAELKSRYDFSVLVKSKLTLYAGWSLVSYKVVFEANGGVPAPPAQSVSPGDRANRPSAMTKTGYTFRDWYSDAGLKSRYDFSSPVTSVLTVYAGWDVDNYRVEFRHNGGNPAPPAQVVSYGDTVRLPALMTKTGYTFRDWYSDAGLKSPYGFSSPVASALTLYAGWSSVGYRVVFNPNGGNPIPSAQVVSHGDRANRPSAMTKTGYTFRDWYSDAGFTRRYDFSSPVISAQTIYAGWDVDSYRVVFNPNGGNPIPSAQVVSYGDTVRLPATMTKTGYTFRDWYIDAGLMRRYDFSTPVTSAQTIYAGWDVVSYGVVFNPNGGNPSPPVQRVAHGDRANRPSAMTKTGYTFRDWYSDAGLTRRYDFSTPVTSAQTVYAGWDVDSYRVEFTPNGGTPAPPVQRITSGDRANRPSAMTKTGYTFRDWYSDAGLTRRYDFSTPVTSAQTIYAGWDVASYRVVFNPNGGTPSPPVQVVAHDDTVRLPAAMTKTGYTFKGWYSDTGRTNPYNFSSPVTSALTLYAGWDVASYKVVFNPNGGTPSPPTQVVANGSKVSSPSAMTKTGYTFKGWYSDAGLTRRYDFSSVVLSPLTLYAKWGTMTNMPVTSSVIEGKYFVFDVGIPQQLTQDLVLRGSFAKGNIANYANDNDYTPTFEYSEDLGSSWRNENDMKTIRIKPGKTSVRVRVRTHADEQKEVLRESIDIGFSPVGTVPSQIAGFTYKTKMVIVDDDVPLAYRKRLTTSNHELMRFSIQNNVFTTHAVIESVNSQREKQLVDSLYRDIVDAVRKVNVGLLNNVRYNGFKVKLLDSLSINFHQPVGGLQMTLGSVRPYLFWSPNAASPNRVALGLSFKLSLNAAIAYWQIKSFWAAQSFNNDGVFGNTLVHEFGHILTLNRFQAMYLINKTVCSRYGGTFAGGVARCFQLNSYGKRFLTDFYDNTNVDGVNPGSKSGLNSPTMVSDYAATNCVEDLAESFVSYVGLDESLVVSDATYAAYRNKIAMYKTFPQAVNFKQEIIDSGLKIKQTGHSKDISSSTSFVVGRDLELRYGGDEGCVRQPIFIE